MTATFLALLARDFRVMRRSFLATFLRVVLQPLLFVFVFAYVLPKTGDGVATGGAHLRYSTVLAPGLVASSILMQGLMAAIFPLVMDLSSPGCMEDRLLAPLPVGLIAVERIVAAAVQALVGGLLVFPAVLLVHAGGQAPAVHVGGWLLLGGVMVGGAVLAAAAGVALGTLVGPPQVQVLFALVLLPMTMLGCVYFPWAALEHIRWLQVAVLANPLVYLSEGLRAALTPQVAHLPAVVSVIALVCGSLCLCRLAVATFTRRALVR